ncbi:hypothetical protein F7230_02335 [Corynebacterium sp. 320]|uniref:hypothetical protein n=1 Tax=Corynebacterium TaxID=1716 RepID=UPI00125CAADA|nr:MULTISPECIES: hypothetical protein [Corynebacterium]KAB1503964.1 hypothetical protein F7230_02335 [Corynebacterium sp. 320]KAB1552937.1 hypothetical protein F7233_04260 [Corynebacterium sp. 321]KAB1553843.1 hypothetical protein F7232_02320 [Corynebacterium sp. 319]KAB3528100.1 hypothetical protein F8354_02335 [Corynebacterium sp. 250]KAB3540412.1 hypothetical protein F8390_04005 [Corynebacterium sp. 366]
MAEQRKSYRRTVGKCLLIASLAAMFLCVAYQDKAWVHEHYQTVVWVSLPLGFVGVGLMAERKGLRFVCAAVTAIVVVVGSLSLISA